LTELDGEKKLYEDIITLTQMVPSGAITHVHSFGSKGLDNSSAEI